MISVIPSFLTRKTILLMATCYVWELTRSACMIGSPLFLKALRFQPLRNEDYLKTLRLRCMRDQHFRPTNTVAIHVAGHAGFPACPAAQVWGKILSKENIFVKKRDRKIKKDCSNDIVYVHVYSGEFRGIEYPTIPNPVPAEFNRLRKKVYIAFIAAKWNKSIMITVI